MFGIIFKQDGVMASNVLVNDYLLNSSGAMAQNAWVKITDKWYYATDSGKILRNKWERLRAHGTILTVMV